MTREKLAAGGQPPSAAKKIINKLQEFWILLSLVTDIIVRIFLS